MTEQRNIWAHPQIGKAVNWAAPALLKDNLSLLTRVLLQGARDKTIQINRKAATNRNYSLVINDDLWTEAIEATGFTSGTELVRVLWQALIDGKLDFDADGGVTGEIAVTVNEKGKVVGL